MSGGSTIKHPPKVSEQAHLNRWAIGYLHISSLGELDINCVPFFYYIDIIFFDFISFLPIISNTVHLVNLFCCPSFDVLVLACTVRIINGMHEAACNNERSKIPTGGEKTEADIARK